ncbi:MAG: STAS domain-containing protein [Wenzhouxiangella sp.]
MKADADGRIVLNGRLGSAEVSALHRQSLGWRTAGLPKLIDLAAVEHADSSALALLLEWRAWADDVGQKIRFVNVPRSLCIMASLSQIEGLLGWRTVDFDADGESAPCCG